MNMKKEAKTNKTPAGHDRGIGYIEEIFDRIISKLVMSLPRSIIRDLKIYSKSRIDRSGNQIFDDLMVYSYAFHKKINFVGSVGKARFDSHYRCCDLLNIPRPSKKLNHKLAVCLSPHRYRQRYGGKIYRNVKDIFTSQFLEHIRSCMVYKKNTCFTVNVHIRRGDISLERAHISNHVKNSYLANVYFVDLVRKIKKIRPDSVFNIYSERQSSENFKEFEDLGCRLWLDTDVVEVWKSLINSDVLVMSKSMFSYVPALYCKGIVLYKPMWHAPIKEWMNVDSENFASELKYRIKMMK